MKTLTHVTWALFALDAALTAVMLIGAITDNGDAAGRGLGLVYAVFSGIVLVALALIAGLGTHFKTTVGLGIAIALEAAPWALLLYEGVGRIAARLG
ncbi:MAG: hypothetical protein LAP38_01865 [Acidobacteriia bacterium]|nr:hypothetical protein [Terriglobia bacterium]